MTAFDRLAAEYCRRPRAEPFLYYVSLYASKGFVFGRPDFFVMGRPVPRHAPAEMILDDHEWFAGATCDCWYLMAASGDMARMWEVVPWELPWFAWTRLSDPLSELRFVPTLTLRRLCPPAA